jgi:hypothetical protein
MKRIILMGFFGILLNACNSGQNNSSDNTDTVDMEERSDEKISTPGGDPAKYDPERGTGKFTHVDVGEKLNTGLASGGEKIYGVKCAGCHKLTEEKLVGPGWKGVTERNRPEWIMNFITNTNEMLNVDPKVQKQLEICLVRMPDQSLPDDDARRLLEFMRKNDGVK